MLDHFSIYVFYTRCMRFHSAKGIFRLRSLEQATSVLSYFGKIHSTRDPLLFTHMGNYDFKSDNLQYDTLARRVNGMNDSSTKGLMFQDFFFIISYRLGQSKCFIFVKIKRIVNTISAKNFARNCEKNNTWNIRHLVHESFVPVIKPPIIYWRSEYFLLAVFNDQSGFCHYFKECKSW